MDETRKDSTTDKSDDEVSGYSDGIGQLAPPLPGPVTYPPTPVTYPPTPVDDTGTGGTLGEMPPPENTPGTGGPGTGG